MTQPEPINDVLFRALKEIAASEQAFLKMTVHFPSPRVPSLRVSVTNHVGVQEEFGPGDHLHDLCRELNRIREDCDINCRLGVYQIFRGANGEWRSHAKFT